MSDQARPAEPTQRRLARPVAPALLLEGAALRDGHAAAEVREEIRLMLGQARPVTVRELAGSLELSAELVRAEDPFEALEARRSAITPVLGAVVAIDRIRAGRRGLEHLRARLELLLRLVRWILPEPPPIAELLDVGAYKGGLIDVVRARRPGLDYVAIDLEPSNAPDAVSVDRMDATRLTFEANSISQVYILDVLEHLADERQVLAALGEAVRVARDYVYAECPNFEDVDYLRGLDLKWCWSDWTGHTMPVTAAVFQRAVDRLCISDIATVGIRESVYDSRHEQLVRLEAPRDVSRDRPESRIEDWRPVAPVRFDRAIHHRVFLEVKKNPFARPIWHSHTPFTDLRPGSTRRLPEEPWKMAALLTTLLDRRPPVSAAEIQRATELAGRIRGGEEVLSIAPWIEDPDTLAGLLELHARAAEGEGKSGLASDLRGWIAELQP